MERELTIVSACFYSNTEPAFRLVQSCEKHGLALSLYGLCEFGNNWRNMKVVKLLEHLQKIETPYVLYTDAADSWMLANEALIMKKFKKHRTDILISGERSLYPFINRTYPNPKSENTARYLCAGSFMGKTEDIKRALKLLLKYPEDSNDQLLWHHLFLDKKMNISIDYNSNVFLTMGELHLDAVSFEPAHPLMFKVTGEYPCVIHFNGGKGGSPNEKNMIRAWELLK